MKRFGVSVLVLAFVWTVVEAGVHPREGHPAYTSRGIALAAPSPSEEFALAGGREGEPWMEPLAVFTGDVVEQSFRLVGARDFPPENQPDGNGIVVAVIGSGVDPGHTDLQDRPGAAASKIVDWVDFSDEGLIETEPVVASGGWAESRYGRLRTGGLRSAGGGLRVGVLREESLDPAGAVEQDLNGNGSTTDVFLVLAVDQSRRGIYNRVYVDTNQNRDFTDEVPLGLYSQSGAFSRFRDRTGAVAPEALHFVLAGLDQDGSRVRLGFDSFGTGTFLAGLMAAGGATGGMEGIAPGASIMSLKVLDSTGHGSWESLSQAIIHASRSGAGVLLVDVGATHLADEQIQSLRELTADVVSRHGVVVLYAAGDGGPGLETSRSPGDSISSLTVGGVTGGYETPSTWPRSAVGPTPAGGWAPDVLAPINAVSTVPRWFSRSGYALGRGTTVSAAYGAGCAALILDACRSSGVSHDTGAVLEALVLSGTRVGGAQVIEQGGGIVNAGRAFHLLGTGLRSPMMVTAEEPTRHREGGVLARDFAPGVVRFFVDNLSGRDASVRFAGDVEWVKPLHDHLLVPPVGERSLLFEYGETPTGLSSAVVYAVEERDGQVTFRTRHVVIRPIPLSLDGVTQLEIGGALEVGECRRHFVLVSAGTTLIEIAARNSGAGDASVQVVGPEGERIYEARIASGSAWTKRLVQPDAGVWEIVLFEEEGSAASRVTLSARAEGFSATPWPPAVDRSETPGGKARLTFGLANNLGDMAVRLIPSRIQQLGDHQQGGLRRDLVTIPAGQSLNRVFTVTEGTDRLYVRVMHSSSRDAAVGLYLHRYDREAGWNEVASSVAGESPAGVIDIPDPPPGAYMIYVDSGQSTGDVQCELLIGLFKEDGAIASDNSSPGYIRKGKVAPVSLLVQYPPALEQIDLQIQVVDDRSGSLTTCLPLTLTGHGMGGLLVDPGGMAPGGKRYVSVSLGPGLSSAGAPMSLVVNGKTYPFVNGEATLPLRAPDEVEITLLLRGAPVMSKTLVIEDLPWTPANTPEPGTDPEKEALRRSLTRRLGF